MNIEHSLSPERCFLEIANEVIRNRNERIDNGERLGCNNIAYSVMRNHDTYFTHSYVYEGDIQITINITLRYYFSHKRSCISLDSLDEKDKSVMDKTMLQIYLLRYVQALFSHHRIDAFVYDLSK